MSNTRKKLSSQQQSSNLVLCSFILVISCTSMFVTDVHCLAVVGDEKSNDQLALLAFKDAITEDPLGVLSTWNNNNASFHFCEWTGVSCSRRHRSRVTQLILSSQKLVGSISPYIGNLSFLKDLSLMNNSLTGRIPHEIGNLFRLIQMDLSYNSLEGEIPHNISHWSNNLISLDMSNNKLLGRIPNALGYLSNLRIMRLLNNNLSGEIPTSLGNLSYLIVLNLGYNNLEGRIPDALSKLTNLKFLSFDVNRLSGIVPFSVYNISSLESFSLSNNQLHGSIPFDVGFTLPNLDYFSVAKNNFTGSIPSSISNMSRVEMLQFQTNNLVGLVPNNLGNLKSLMLLQLARNKLGGSDDLSFINSLINCTNLMRLIIGGNNFGGVLPSSIANLTSNLNLLDLGENQIHGNIPPGIQNLQGLTVLVLGPNQFTGSIPPSIGLLQNLGILVFDRNKLSGSIPSSFGNLTRLIELYIYDNKLTGLIPQSLGNCQSLQILYLASNRLSGSIPKQIFQLPSLSRSLDLSNNSLTGSLPLEVGNLKNIGAIGLSGNKLSGEIPNTIGDCLSLAYLDLQGNFFQGNIPPSITSLKGLQTLILSHNNLSGILPKGLENLTELIELDLSYNNLEGEIPKDGVFKNISAFSIGGNNEVCGGVPELKLPNCSVPVNPSMERKQRKSDLVKIIVIIIIAVVLILTLIVFFAIIYWKKKSKTKLPSTTLDVGNHLMEVSYNELLRATNGFNDSTNLLGIGSFGSVYKGFLQQNGLKPVAVKVLRLQQRGATKSFMAECDALRKVRHRNLVKIITCCSSTDFQGNDFKALVFEFMGNGSLEDWFHPTNDDQLHAKNLNLERRLSIAVDVASALNYLHHDCESPVAHCDLKPSNVLLNDDLVAHVGDFGLAKFLFKTSTDSQQLNEQDASSIAIKGSIGYVPPEYGMGGQVSTQGDVYSYGILLLEMFTGKRPTDDMFKDGLNIHSFCKMHAFPEQVLNIVESQLLLELEGEDLHNNETNNYNIPRSERRNRARHTTREIVASIIQIGVICSSELPSDRISMDEVIVDVQTVKNRYLGIGM